MGDGHALGWRRQVLDHDGRGRDVGHPLLVLEIEMVVVRRIGVEIAARGIHRHFAQQPRRPELVQCVVDRRQRDIDVGGLRFGQQLLGAHMPVLAAEQDLGQRHALPGRPQSCHAQHRREARPARRHIAAEHVAVVHGSPKNSTFAANI
jgi:hypothetical protein